MTERLEEIFLELAPCECFADVGCDHGYIAEAMLKKGKAKRVVVSDISAPSLKKAQKLLRPFGDKVTSLVCDGLNENHRECDQVLVAGMGGEEIISILFGCGYMVKRAVLQPMKNVDKLRKRLLIGGYAILKDRIFYAEGKFYNLLTVSPGEDFYTEDELVFGRDNLRNRGADFLKFLEFERERCGRLLTGDLPEDVRKRLSGYKKLVEDILNEVR